MKARSRLKHAAAGLLGLLISRNNDVNGYWGPGLLYRDVSTSPHIIELDLLSASSQPASESASTMAANSAAFLRAALEKKELSWEELTRATVTFQFNADIPKTWFRYPCAGDPFVCTVALDTVHPHAAVVKAIERCQPYRHFAFAQRGSW